ncbi:8128_t:CDS:2 [Paraglomus occultum]|uniref:8128_t:CDS:1 n=1 Tax=Paraglomus occultum TaxID=144539 RepID=A0A9N9BDE6_9GLOM|nr:8128_t:CDS:2 [Paraglomus occultum]
MGGCCSLVRRRKNAEVDSKFKVIDGRRYQQLDDSNYVLPNDSGEEERLDMQHILFDHFFDGNFSAPVDQLLRSGARVLDACCGSGVWSIDLAKRYPNSYFIGVDIAPVVLADEKPSNLEFVEYNVLDGLPFNSNTFDYVFARATLAVYTRAQWTELAIPEYARVTKPGGWVELMEFSGLLSGECENVQRLNTATATMFDSKNLIPSPGYEIQSFLEQSGFFTNIGYTERTLPIGPKGDKYAEMGIRDWRDFYHGMRFPFSKIMQVTGEHYDAIVEAAIKELIRFGCTWDTMRAWGKEERLDVQRIILKHAFNGDFSEPVDQLLKYGARVLDVGSWTSELAKEYRNSYFIDIAPVILTEEKPSNVDS